MLTEFLSQNPHITNRLACLVREVMELPYLKVALVVFACLGVHLVEPFSARTINYFFPQIKMLLILSSGNSTRDVHAGLGNAAHQIRKKALNSSQFFPSRDCRRTWG